MRPLFIILTDRGNLRAGWLLEAPSQSSQARPPDAPQAPPPALRPKWHPVEALSFVLPRQHLVEQVTDAAGAYSAAESSGPHPRQRASSPSEIHWKMEADRRVLQQLCEVIARILDREKPESWSLAAPADIHHQLLNELPTRLRQRLSRVVAKNLVDSPLAQLWHHFAPPP